MYKQLLAILFSLSSVAIIANENKVVEYQGQLSLNGQYAPTDGHYTLFGVRYLPQLNIDVPSKGQHKFDFEFAANISSYWSRKTDIDAAKTTHYEYLGELSIMHRSGEHISSLKLLPYRFWMRYRYKSLELRLGLQKIDFGSSTLLRPLQWFNSMDPRDPLKITNGVFGILGRYYFENNANIWLWCLTMNTDRRGMDVLVSDKYLPEFGGRVQYPVPKGELAFTYNHRWVDARDFVLLDGYDELQEDRFALDGKWDVGVGLWFESTYSFLHIPLDMLTNQFALNVGVDYTFGVGNGLNVAAEHLLSTYDKKPFRFENINNITALQINYPIAMFDHISLMTYYSWEQRKVAAYLSYMHSFEKLSLYANAYYNSEGQEMQSSFGVQNDMMLGDGVGMQVMLVFNH